MNFDKLKIKDVRKVHGDTPVIVSLGTVQMVVNFLDSIGWFDRDISHLPSDDASFIRAYNQELLMATK